MNLRETFKAGGTGVIGTSNSQGEVNMAIYAIPMIVDDETIVFGMTEGTTHENLRENPHASYLFMAKGEGYRGARLKLLLSEVKDSGEILEGKKLGLEAICGQIIADKLKYVAFFKVMDVRPLL